MKLLNILAVSLGLLAAGSMTAAVDCGTDLQTLTVATSQPYPPFEFTDANNNLVGFDIDVACELRKRLGFAKVQFKNVTPFDIPTFVAGLNNGTFTLAISAISMTAPNLALAAAVKYNDDNQGFLWNSANFALTDKQAALSSVATVLATLNTDVGFGLPNTVGVPRGSYELSVINAVDGAGNRVYPNITAVFFNDVPSAVAALNNGRILTYFANAATVTFGAMNFSTTANPLKALAVGTTQNPVFIDPTAVNVTSIGLGIFMNPTCCQLYANVLAAIAAMAADGTLAALQAKWGTGTFTPLSDAQQATITPTGCADTVANLPVRCAILQFAFDKNCPCMPAIVATVPAGSIM